MKRVLLLTALTLLGSAAPAQATLLVKSDSTGLLVQDKNNAGDRVVVSAGTLFGSPTYVVTNNNASDLQKFDRQGGCVAGDVSTQVICGRLSGSVRLVLLGGNDEAFTVRSGAVSVNASMGDGVDNYTGGAAQDAAFLGAGSDRANTGAGNDQIGTGTGLDFAEGGEGDDLLDAEAPGAAADNDRLNGGPGDDRLLFDETAGSVGQRVIDSPNNDLIVTGPGNDSVLAGTGDLLSPFFSGEDAGALGADIIRTNDGNDRILSKEAGTAVRDVITCGFGQDQVEADSQDQIDEGSCDDRVISPVGETPNVRIGRGTLTVRRNRTARVRLRCPRGTRGIGGCKGRLSVRLELRGARRARKRYEIRAGRSKTVTVRLSRGSVRTLRGRQRRGRRTRAIVASVERGRKGRKTTVRNPRVRLSRR